MIPFLITLLVVFIIISGFISAAQTALFSLSSMKIKGYLQSSESRKQIIASLLSRPRDLLVTLLMVDILANVLAQNIASSLFGSLQGFSEATEWGLKVGVPLALTLVFGEILPKSITLPNNEKVAHVVAPAVLLNMRVFGPVSRFMSRIASYLSRALFFFLKQEKPISTEELQALLKTAKVHGVLHPDEIELVDGYLWLQDVSAKELMRPREDMLFYDLNDPLTRLVHLFVDQECSRLPVCDEDLQNTKGIITAKDFFLHRNEIKESKDLIPLLKKPFYVPESIPGKVLLRELARKKRAIALIVDEYGAITGLISREDLIEVVVGEITDRRDQKKHYTRASQDVIIASGKLDLLKFEELFGVTLVSENNMVTIGGWLTEQIGDIPKNGAQYKTADFLFQILAADPNRVRRIYIRRLRPTPQTPKRSID